MFLYDLEGLSALKGLTSELGSMKKTVETCQAEMIIFVPESVSECSNRLSEAATELNVSVTKLIESYRSTLQTSLDKYRNEVDFFKAEDGGCLLDEDGQLLDEAVRSLENFYQNSAAKFRVQLLTLNSTFALTLYFFSGLVQWIIERSSRSDSENLQFPDQFQFHSDESVFTSGQFAGSDR